MAKQVEMKLNLYKAHCATYKAIFVVMFQRMDFSWLASARQNLLWYCSTNTKCHEDKATHHEITIKLGLAEDAQMI